MKWLTIKWWKYLLVGCTGWTNFLCRINGHKCGPIWYNFNGFEPDMHCVNCGEDIG